MTALGSAAAKAVAGGRSERPNILWLVSEDNNPWLGCYGDRLAHTPNIDALAQKGILFRNSYSNAPVCAPTRFAILTGAYPESCAPAHHMRAIAKIPAAFSTYPQLLRKAGYFCSNNAKTDYNCDIDPKSIWDRQGRTAHWRDRAPGQPFMAVFNYEITHESMLFKPTPGRVDGHQVRIPRYLPDTPAVRQDYASYYNLIEKMDGEIGKRLAELEADGLSKDTIVFYYSDNGGALPRSKHYSYDEGYRCPLIISAPPKWRHLTGLESGSTVETPVCHVDLAPTVLSIAGLAREPQMAGRTLLAPRHAVRPRYAFGMRNRMDERIDFTRSVTDGRWRYIRNYMPHRSWGIPAAYQSQMKSYQEWYAGHIAGTLSPTQGRFFEKKPFEELYDLRADPDQVANLAATASADLRRLSNALDAHMIGINDNGFIPEGMAGEGFFESRDPKVYPLRRLMGLGAAAARGNPDNLAGLRQFLADPNPIVRYWATTGLLILEAGGATARTDLAHLMESDPAPEVRVVAAEALGLLGDDRAVDALSVLSAPDKSWQLRLHALAALTAIGIRARPAIESIEAAANDETNIDVRSAGRYLVAVLNGTYTPAYPIFDTPAMMKMIREGRIRV